MHWSLLCSPLPQKRCLAPRHLALVWPAAPHRQHLCGCPGYTKKPVWSDGERCRWVRHLGRPLVKHPKRDKITTLTRPGAFLVKQAGPTLHLLEMPLGKSRHVLIWHKGVVHVHRHWNIVLAAELEPQTSKQLVPLMPLPSSRHLLTCCPVKESYVREAP